MSTRSTLSRRQMLVGSLAGIASLAAWRVMGTVPVYELYAGRGHTPIIDAPGMDTGPMRAMGEGTLHDAPLIARGPGGAMIVAWIMVDEQNRERLVTAPVTDGRIGAITDVSDVDAGRAFHPALVATAGGFCIAWSERLESPRHWNLRVRMLDTSGQPVGPIRTIADEGISWAPALAYHDGIGVLMAYEHWTGDRFRIAARLIDGNTIGEPVVVSDADDAHCRRPDVVADGKGGFYVAWDCATFRGIRVRRLDGITPERPVYAPTEHPAMHLAPALAWDAATETLYIAWYTNATDDPIPQAKWDIPRWVEVRALRNNQWHRTVGEMPGKYPIRVGEDQHLEFPRLAIAPHGRLVLTARPSHNFTVQTYGQSWSELYRMPRDGWGGRGQYFRGVFDDEGTFWTVRRDLNQNVLQGITGLDSAQHDPPQLVPSMEALASAAMPTVGPIHARPNWQPIDDLEGSEPLHFFYGDLHGHSFYSDASNDVDEYYRLRRDYYQDDFASITDHDTFVGKSILPSGWEHIKAVTHAEQQPGFVTLFGQEYTTARYPAGIGHKCLFSTDEQVPLLDHRLEQYDDGVKLMAAARELGMLMIPHHTAWTGSDWENADDSVQSLIEIVSCHGRFEFAGNRPIPHRGGMRGMFVQDALARGHRIGIIGGSDSHTLLWHHGAGWKRDCNRTGIAGVLATANTREAIFDALKNRRCFGATGVKPRLDFRVNDHLMGSDITAPAGERVSLYFYIESREQIAWITVVRNNEDWYHGGADGFLHRLRLTDDAPNPGLNWYYVRVEFRTGDMAWTSPVWVTVG